MRESLVQKLSRPNPATWIGEGKVKLIVDQVLPMPEVGKAHQHLANRGTRGKVILTP